VDTQLVQGALASPAGFTPIVERYYQMVFAVGYAHLRDVDAAEELVQETFLRAYLHLPSLKDARTLPAWLNRVARNLALQWLEKGQSRSRLVPTVSMEAVPPEAPDPKSESPRERAVQKDEERRLLAAVDKLPSAQREIILMHFLEEVHKSEIARRLNVHPATVGRQLTAGLAKLREQLSAVHAPLAGLAGRNTAGVAALVGSAAVLNSSARAALLKATADSGALGAAMTLQPLGLLAGIKASGGMVASAMAIAAIATVGIVAMSRPAPDAAEPKARASKVAAASFEINSRRAPAPRIATAAPSASARVVASRSSRPSPQPAAFASAVSDLSQPGDAETTEPNFMRARVVDKDGKPLEGCLVDLWTWVPGKETYTNRDGWFRFIKIDRDDNPDLRITKDGYTPYYVPFITLGLQQGPIVLEQGTYLEGTVTFQDGKPAPGALVRADMGRQQGKGVMITSVWYEAYSDASGRYRLFVPPSTYKMEARAGNEATTADKIELAKDAPKTVDLKLSPAATLRVQLIDSVTSEPVVGATIDDWQRPTLKGTSDGNGIIEIPALIPAEVSIGVEKKGYARFWLGRASSATRRENRDRSGFNQAIQWQRDFDSLDVQLQAPLTSFTITMEKAATFRGLVVDPDGSPVAGATVAPALTGTGNSITGDTRYSVKTDASGKFECPLPPSFEDSYNLVAHDGSFHQWRKWANGTTEVYHTMPGQEIDDVVIRLTRPGTVVGRVIDTKGQPVGGTHVQYTSAKKDENRYYLPSTKTAADGTFELKFVPPGEQYIRLGQFYPVPREEIDPKDSYVKLVLAEGETTRGITLVQYRKDD